MLVYVISTIYDTPIAIEEVEDAVQKENGGPGRLLGYKEQIITRRLGQKSLTKRPAIEFFFFNHNLQRRKINPHIEFIPVPNQLLCPYPVSDEWKRSQFCTKSVDNTRTKTTLFGKRCPCNHIFRGEMSNSDNHLSPVYTAQTNPGSTRVKTNPGSIQLCSQGQKPKTPVNTNLERTRVNFSHAGQLVAFTGEVIIFRNQVYCFVNSCCRSRQTRP